MTGHENCMLVFCPNRGKIPGISYFRLTKNRYHTWLQALGLDPEERQYSHFSRVCSVHFEKSDITITPTGKMLLAHDAIPKLNLGPNIQYRKCVLSQRKALSELSQNTEVNTPVSSKYDLATEGIFFEEPALEIEIPCDDHNTKSESRSSSTLSCDSVESLWEGNTLFNFLVLLKICCLAVLHKSADFFCHSEEIPQGLKRKLEENMGSFSSSSDSAGLKGTPKKRRRDVRNVHTYCLSPRQIQQKQQRLLVQKKQLQTKFYNAKKKVQRLQRKVTSLQQVTRELQKKNLVSTDAVNTLNKSFTGIPLAILKRCLSNLRNLKKGKKQITSQFPKELRSFAMTLQFYSSKAYDYVRKTFNLALPSPSIIRTWLNSIDCEPGFTTCSFETLKSIVLSNKEKNEETLCSLVMDEMAIRKQIEFVGKKTWGYVNLGTEISDDTLNCATEVFVLLVVSMKARWKIPIAYFFIKSLTAAEKANIVKQALIKLKEVGVSITSLTCDGPSANFSMAKELGVDFTNMDNIKSYFLHPIDKSRIYIIFDPCHMLKLLRNNWAKLSTLIDMDGNSVNFNFIKKLYDVQEAELFRFGTKLRKAHMQWEKQKMKVDLAAQMISNSVADAIQMLKDDFQHPDFLAAGPTIRFLKLYDALFDIMNSRNPFGKGSKTPLKKETENYWRPLLEEAKEYTKKLKNTYGVYLHGTKNKTPFLGFLINISSYIGMYEDYVQKENTPLKYILTYKTSQDHLELFFLCVRSRNGWNNNPTAHQFYYNYKRLVLNIDIKGSSGNCVALDNTNIIFAAQRHKNTPPISSVDELSLIKKYNLDVPDWLEIEEEDIIRFIPEISSISENVVAYIAGFVVKKLKKIVFCTSCKLSLEEKYSAVDDTHFKLLNKKNRGGLIRPSLDVIEICIIIEKRLRYILSINNNRMPKENNFFDVFINEMCANILQTKDRFADLDNHIFDHSLLENPQAKLVKNIVLIYTKIRLYSFSKKQTEQIQGELIRKKLSKLILFSGQ